MESIQNCIDERKLIANQIECVNQMVNKTIKATGIAYDSLLNLLGLDKDLSNHQTVIEKLHKDDLKMMLKLHDLGYEL